MLVGRIKSGETHIKGAAELSRELIFPNAFVEIKTAKPRELLFREYGEIVRINKPVFIKTKTL